jgi:transcriptional regulator with XRE-family HTH domain
MFGPALKEVRTRQGMTQQQLAESAGINTAQVSHLETDRQEPSARMIRKLAEALNCSADELLWEVKATHLPKSPHTRNPNLIPSI